MNQSTKAIDGFKYFLHYYTTFEFKKDKVKNSKKIVSKELPSKQCMMAQLQKVVP